MLLLDRTTTPDIRPLRAFCTGDVVVPGERVWDEVLETWDLEPGAEPAAVVYPASDYDVIAVLAFVRSTGLEAVLAGTPEAADLPDDLGRTVLVQRAGTRGPWASLF